MTTHWVPPELRFYVEETTMRKGNWGGPPANADEERAQRILDQRPEGCGFNFRDHGDTMRRIASEEGLSVGAVQRIWRRQTYTHLRRKGADVE